MEAKELLSAVLEVVGTLKEKFKAEYIVNMLVGNETSEIQSYKHNELEVFGSGSDEEEKTWNAVIRQALIAGYLAKDIENYGLLKITEKGKEFIKKPVSFKITEDNEFDEEEEEVPVRGGAACAVDPALFLDDEGFTQEVVQASGSASFRYFPGSVSGSDGHYLSGNVGRIAEYSGCRSR